MQIDLAAMTPRRDDPSLRGRELLAPLALSHLVMRRCLAQGSIAVDATVGNGHDTVFLAETVGPTGTVYGLDVQPAALRATEERLARAGIGSEVVKLRLLSHGDLAELLRADGVATIDGAMFNLGYLPGGDKELITTPETTCRAISAVLPLLLGGGAVTVMFYGGHPGGDREAAAVRSLITELSSDQFAAFCYRRANGAGGSSELLVIERR